MAMDGTGTPEDMDADRRRSELERRMLRRAVHPGPVGHIVISLDRHVPVIVYDFIADVVMKQCGNCTKLGAGAWCTSCERQDAPKSWRFVDEADDG